jgi:HEPN domain-containing protein
MEEEHQELRETLHKDAERVAEELAQDPSNLAVILTGPLALGRMSETDKLYFAVITNKEDGIIEHRFLDDGWGGVERPIEMGKFPLKVARYLLENGYTDMVSYKSLEAFRCGRVLWEKEGVGTEMIEGAKRHIPRKAFIGEGLHGAVSALDDAVSLLKNGDYANAVLVAREAATKAVGMVIKEEMKKGGISFLETARELLPPQQFELYQEIMDIKEVDAGIANEYARRAKDFAEYALLEIGVDPDHIFGFAK